MTGKFQIIRIDDLLVRKTNLQVGENVIECDNISDESYIKQAVRINVSPDGEMSITPYEGVSCYIKSHKSYHWKLLKANWTVPLRVKDTCLVFPIKLWFKVIPIMESSNENHSPKRKFNEVAEYEVPDKRHCSEMARMESSACILNDNNDESDFIMGNCINNTEESECIDNNGTDTIDSKSVQFSDNDSTDIELKDEPCFEPCSVKESNEELNIELPKNVSEDTTEEIKAEFQEHVTDHNNLNSEVEQSSVDVDPSNDNTNTNTNTSNNTNNSNDTNTNTSTAQPSATIVSNIPREKCKYGSQCYRINSEHKATFSHPDDPDYDMPDNRPECPYGIQCYRKNSQHKLDYKHTRSKRKRTETPVTPRSPEDFSDLEDSEEEPVDESDYDPSFIDDDSLEEFESDFDYDE